MIDPRFSESECGTPQPSSNFFETIKSLAGNDSFASAASAAAGAREKYKIITYIHVIASSDSPSDGYISVSRNINLSYLYYNHRLACYVEYRDRIPLTRLTN